MSFADLLTDARHAIRAFPQEPWLYSGRRRGARSPWLRFISSFLYGVQQWDPMVFYRERRSS